MTTSFPTGNFEQDLKTIYLTMLNSKNYPHYAELCQEVYGVSNPSFDAEKHAILLPKLKACVLADIKTIPLDVLKTSTYRRFGSMSKPDSFLNYTIYCCYNLCAEYLLDSFNMETLHDLGALDLIVRHQNKALLRKALDKGLQLKNGKQIAESFFTGETIPEHLLESLTVEEVKEGLAKLKSKDDLYRAYHKLLPYDKFKHLIDLED